MGFSKFHTAPSIVLLLALLLVPRTSKAIMWSKPLNSDIFATSAQLYRWVCYPVLFVAVLSILCGLCQFIINVYQFGNIHNLSTHRDCRPGFLCINLGDQELHNEDEEKNNVENKMAKFFKPAALIVPKQAGADDDEEDLGFVCETHTVLLRGRCWVLCDSVKLWPCGQPLVKMRAPKSVRDSWQYAG